MNVFATCRSIPRLAVTLLYAAFLTISLTGCGSGGNVGETSGPSFTPSFATSAYHADKALAQNGCTIDTSDAQKGYVSATGSGSSRLKLLVTCGNMSYNYDMKTDGDPTIAPLNMGDGTYTVSVMRNTSGSNYVALASTTISVTLNDQFQPFIRPSQICNYRQDSDCVKKASELVANAENQGDAVAAIYEYITSSISYDKAKATELSSVTGYLSDPDETLNDGKGICIDYAVLAASMLRSQGIPCKIVTGNLQPDGIYHAWNLVYIDGTWHAAAFTVESGTWARIDTTLDAAGDYTSKDKDLTYEDRYAY